MTSRLRTADTSVVVPALASWHSWHHEAVRACEGVERLPAHVVVETVSSLTRLPGGLQIDPETAVAIVRRRFPGAPMVLDPDGTTSFLDEIAVRGVRGGAVYDALVATTARTAGALLISHDRRAAPTYRAVGVTFELR